MRIRYYTDTTIQIFKTYTETHICCYIGITSRILTDSYRVNKREYELHVFIESLDNDIPENYSKNIQENFALYSTVFCPKTWEYGAKKTSVITVVLCSDNQCLLSVTNELNSNLNNEFPSSLVKNINLKYNHSSCYI